MLSRLEGIGMNEVLSSSGIIAKAVAGGAVLFGGIVLFVLQLLLPESWIESKLLLLNVLSFLLLFLGLALVLWSIVSMRNLKMEVIEKRTLKIAKKNIGILTAAQLALEARINISLADKILRKFQIKGVVEIDANQQGAVCFKFYDLMT